MTSKQVEIVIVTDTLSTEHADLQPAIDRAKRLVEGAFAPNTRRSYAATWRVFVRWCEVHGLSSLPATSQTVTLYVSELVAGEVAGAPKRNQSPDGMAKRMRRPATAASHLSSIAHHHMLKGLESPTEAVQVQLVMESARKTYGATKNKKAPIVSTMLPTIIASIEADKTLSAAAKARNRTLILFGFYGAFRRSELVLEIEVTDIEEKPEGLVVHLRHSKTDQTRRGRYISIMRLPHLPELCPAAAVLRLRKTLSENGVTSGPLFRSMSRNSAGKPLGLNSVALVIKRTVRTAGYNDPAVSYAGHSLRAGYVTSAARAKSSLASIMEVTGHTDLRTLGEYIRLEGSWENHATKGFSY